MANKQLSNNVDNLNQKLYNIESEKANAEDLNNSLMVEINKKNVEIKELKFKLSNLDDQSQALKLKLII